MGRILIVVPLFLVVASVAGRGLHPCDCRDTYSPVCGINGRSYSNKCKANCKGVEIAYVGKCCKCSTTNEPVCGKDGATYKNKCFAQCAEVAVASSGACSAPASCGPETPGAECVCSYIYDPVCGCNGKTYASACLASCQGIKLHTPGECVATPPPTKQETCGPETSGEDCFCTADYDPVCGCNLKTYSNACSAECQSILKYTLGECSEPLGNSTDFTTPPQTPPLSHSPSSPNTSSQVPAPVCGPETSGAGCFCSQDYDPVCGCNGKTYSNACAAECKNILVHTPGECPDVPPTSPPLTTNSTQSPLPLSTIAVTGPSRATSPLPTTVSATCGPVKINTDCVCSQDYDPVCGCNSATYPNACTAECSGIMTYTPGECPDPTPKMTLITAATTDDAPTPPPPSRLSTYTKGFKTRIQKCGPEKDGVGCICTEDYKPVCGCNGKTYANSCLAECSNINDYTVGACIEPTPSPGGSADTSSTSGTVQLPSAVLVTASAACGAETLGAGCFCSQDYDPVCGCNGKTYSNACAAECKNILVHTPGECVGK